ncbi:DUF1449 domain-containing protein [Gilvimarinus sp. SDUM040013]|uniref:DUF1449 domain-containing protein n=1 Tax=Gilvimarinus gilvus TaxID=3058038 RepID=A0ABU4RVH1_9GAMM|nr:DUF1449 domain-containing protein [Gilvimarinus sp. SDUM040013]MDO3387693.1 DUF1449 domain-containing protein [Gilvimarinus sp. SDUM040013]MDX6848866.1 DUF1449 domain-containing protein [Gilvimarinus sp. SDUM040013]
MFTIFFLEDMDPFYQNISSFPTVIFTFLLVITVLYWLVAVLGFIDIEFLDFDLPDPDGVGAQGDGLSNPEMLAGLMLRFGLHGVPLTIIISFIALFGWLISYYIVHFLFGFIPGGFVSFLVGIPVLLFCLYLAVMVTAVVIKPIRPLFKSSQYQAIKYVVGQTAIVRTSVVDETFGEAILEDGGAGLLLKVRSTSGETFSKGDRVVLLEHLKEKNTFRVISEKEFLGNE